MRGRPRDPPDRSRMAAASSSAFDPRPPCPSTAAISSLSPRPARAEPRELLARPVRTSAINRMIPWLRTSQPYILARCRVPLGSSALLPVSVAFVRPAAAASRPTRRLHQAQGAIDAARAAGADIYAPEELKAARGRARHTRRTAVGERDYPACAQQRARQPRACAERRQDGRRRQGRARSAAERLLADVTSAIAVSAARLQAAEAARAPKTATDPLKEGLASARQATEDAGKALASQDYLGAKARLDGIVVSLSALLQRLPKTDTVVPAKSQKRPR